METPAEIASEMQRKPDPQLLLEWIYGYLSDSDPDTVVDVHQAIDAYFEAFEDES